MDDAGVLTQPVCPCWFDDTPRCVRKMRLVINSRSLITAEGEGEERRREFVAPCSAL